MYPRRPTQEAMLAPPMTGFPANQPPPPPPPMTGFPANQPPPVAPFHLQMQPQGPWMTGLYNCDADDECCLTCFCPCITFGQVAEIIDRGSTSCCGLAAVYALVSVTGFLPLYTCFYRFKLRQQYGLREEPCADCCVQCWCECCSLCQMYRELKRRGFDMSIGWHGNMDNQRQMAIAPPVYQDMNR